MAVTKNQRILLVVNSLVSQGDPWAPLYTFLEDSGVAVPQSILGDDYRKVSVLRGANATAGNFVNRLKSLTTTAGVKAVDVLLQLHGTNEPAVHFADGKVRTGDLRDRILAKDIPDRLRLLYSTCCYGASHASHFVQAGFETVIGSRAINANAGVELPIFCTLWANGKTVEQSLALADDPTTRAIQDGIARALSPRFRDANSKKTIKGRRTLKISSNP